MCKSGLGRSISHYLCDFMGGRLSSYITTLLRLVSIDITDLIFHVTLQGHCNFIPTLPILVAIDIVVVDLP